MSRYHGINIFNLFIFKNRGNAHIYSTETMHATTSIHTTRKQTKSYN